MTNLNIGGCVLALAVLVSGCFGQAESTPVAPEPVEQCWWECVLGQCRPVPTDPIPGDEWSRYGHVEYIESTCPGVVAAPSEPAPAIAFVYWCECLRMTDGSERCVALTNVEQFNEPWWNDVAEVLASHALADDGTCSR